MTPALDPSLSVVIPVGSGDAEIGRLYDLLDSIRAHPPIPAPIILVDDADSPRPFARLLSDGRIQLVVIPNPRNNNGVGNLGGLFVGVTAALEWIHLHTQARCVLKLDTDALVIGPLHALGQYVNDPSVGLVGVVGRTCDHDSDLAGWELASPSPIIRALNSVLRPPRPYSRQRTVRRRRYRFSLTEAQIRSFRSVLPDVLAATRNGYRRLHYCQGGAYLVSREMVQRMATLGCFDRCRNWAPVPIGEDVIMAMYAYAVGLRVMDASGVGAPFASDWRELPFSPTAALARGHSLIHTVKDNYRFSESEVRTAFRRARDRPQMAATEHVLSCGPLRFYCTDTAAAVLASTDPKVLLVAGHVVDNTLDRLASTQSLLSAYKELATDHAVICLIDLERLASLTFATDMAIESTVPLVVTSYAPLTQRIMDAFHIVPLERVRGVRSLHVSGNAESLSTSLRDRLERIARIRTAFLPSTYVFTGLYISQEDSHVFVEHTGLCPPDVITCGDPSTARLLSRLGRPAQWTGHDGLHLFISSTESLPATMDITSSERFGFDLAAPSSIVADGPVNSLEKMRHAFDVISSTLRFARMRSELTPVLFNTSLDHRDRHDVWSALRYVGFSKVFPEFLSIDVISMARRDRLGDAIDIIRSSHINRFVGTSEALTLLMFCCKIPSYLLTFNTHTYSKSNGIMQWSTSPTELFSGAATVLEHRTALTLTMLRRLRCKWLDTLRRSLEL